MKKRGFGMGKWNGAADKLWLPLTLAGEKLKGKLVLDEHENIVENTLAKVTGDKDWTDGGTA